MPSRLQQRRQRLERKTARVFFSSPFGGLEEEREELTKKYWPQLESLCNKVGYEFIPVDLRWGITSEMSSSAVTIKVCLSEMDRSDMIVGFFGQRYGWHGDNELLQKSFDVAAEKYPWVNDYRDRAVTELEYLHGHLMDPGARAACFFFRDKAYDDIKLEEALESGDEGQIRKFRASTDGQNAKKLLDNLKARVEKTRDKCLAVHMKYKTPQEGARLMFETIEKHFKEVLLASPAEHLTPREEENVQHDVFLASRLGMGGTYVGGAKYLDMIDKHLSKEQEGVVKPIVVLGNAGSGKSCLISNWVSAHQEKNPLDIVVYHFVGSSSESTVPKLILSRLVDELYAELKERNQQDENDLTPGALDIKSLVSDSKDEERDLIRKLRALMGKVKETGAQAFLIVDPLNKVDVSGQIMKALYWLPKDIPSGVHLLVSTLSSDTTNIQELDDRGYEKINISPLDHDDREEIALATLKLRGKTLSTEQRERVFNKTQTENPLFLKTLLQELLSFGEFFQLDAYIDDLLQADDTKELFLKFLKRLEEDYNPKDYEGNLIEKMMCCVLVARQGLSESEIKSILHISDQVWSAMFFALDDFLILRSGLYGFAYDELADAVKERYCQGNEKLKEYTLMVAGYFEDKLKERSVLYDTVIPQRVLKELPWLLMKSGEKDHLEKCIIHPPIFNALKSGHDMYDLVSYWNATGLTGEEIVAKHQKVIDDQLALFYSEEVEKGGNQKKALDKMIPYVYDLAQFLESAGHTKSVEPLLERSLQMEKTLHGDDSIQNDPVVANHYVNIANTLACLYVDTEQFEKADNLHREVLHIKEKFASIWKDGNYLLAQSLNGLGVLHFKQNNFEEAESFYTRSLAKHREANSAGLEMIADLLNNLGSVYWSLGNYEEAAKSFEESLQMYDDAFFGSLPPNVGGTMLNLAMVYRRMEDKVEQAEPLYIRALEIRENAYGPNHHEVGQTLLSYSAYLMNRKSPKTAEVAKRAAEIYENSFGLSHINTLNALENVALAYLVMDKPSEAHPYFKKAGIQKHQLGRMDTSIPKLNAVMADYYLNSEQNEEARQLFGRIVTANFATDRDFAALDYLDSQLPSERRPARKWEYTVEYAIEKFPGSQMLLGRVQEKLSQKGDAEAMLKVLKNGKFGVEVYNSAYQAFTDNSHRKEGMDILNVAYETFPEDKIIMYNLGSAYAAFKEYVKACTIFKKLLELDPDDLSTLESYARVLSLSGRPHEGKELYNKALKIAEEKEDSAACDRLNSTLKLLSEM